MTHAASLRVPSTHSYDHQSVPMGACGRREATRFFPNAALEFILNENTVNNIPKKLINEVAATKGELIYVDR